uniref:Uncharacterized protein n=1 Tax=Anguilla anguilla TaxID=7936 RepID=A0A0E9P9V7_ANGAN
MCLCGHCPVRTLVNFKTVLVSRFFKNSSTFGFWDLAALQQCYLKIF